MSSSRPRAEGYPPTTDAQQEQLAALAELLRTAPLNLLSPRDRELVWERHVGESARIGAAIDPGRGERWIDIGTGGGLPGLVLAITYPETAFTLLDARQKKIDAVRGFSRGLGLTNVEVVAARAEVVAREPQRRESYDGTVSRALGRLATVIELSRGFVRPGGRIVAVRGGRVLEELAGVRSVVPQLGVDQPSVVEISETARATWLVTMHARGRAPASIPRADGVPASRPLGTD